MHHQPAAGHRLLLPRNIPQLSERNSCVTSHALDSVTRNASLAPASSTARSGAITSRSRKAWRKRVSVMTRPEHNELFARDDACAGP